MVSVNLEKSGVSENLRDLPEYEFEEIVFRFQKKFNKLKKTSERTCLQYIDQGRKPRGNWSDRGQFSDTLTGLMGNDIETGSR